jgi:hypothetical protein
MQASGAFPQLTESNHHPNITTPREQMATSGGVEKELKRAEEKVIIESSKLEAKVHRYPAIFRNLMSKDDRYFVPRCVAIGPYHHGAANVQRAEEMKRAAAYILHLHCVGPPG